MSLASIQTLAFVSYCSPVQDRMAHASTGVYEFCCIVIGQHVYKRVWIPLIDNNISTPMWKDNERDEYAVNYR